MLTQEQFALGFSTFIELLSGICACDPHLKVLIEDCMYQSGLYFTNIESRTEAWNTLVMLFPLLNE